MKAFLNLVVIMDINFRFEFRSISYRISFIVLIYSRILCITFVLLLETESVTSANQKSS